MQFTRFFFVFGGKQIPIFLSFLPFYGLKTVKCPSGNKKQTDAAVWLLLIYWPVNFLFIRLSFRSA